MMARARSLTMECATAGQKVNVQSPGASVPGAGGKGRNKRRQRLFRLLASLMLWKFYRTGIIRFESDKVTHAGTEIWRMWQQMDLQPQGPS